MITMSIIILVHKNVTKRRHKNVTKRRLLGLEIRLPTKTYGFNKYVLLPRRIALEIRLPSKRSHFEMRLDSLAKNATCAENKR